MRTPQPMNISKQHSISQATENGAAFTQRLRSFLVRDLIPSLILFIVLSICTTLAAEKIYRAKISRCNTFSMILDGSCQTPDPFRDDLTLKNPVSH